MPVASAPERRSAADLQRILDSLIGDAGFVMAGKLPEVLAKYESAHHLSILDPAEANGLREVCAMHSEMELGPDEMFQLLKTILKSSPARSPDATEPSGMSASQSLPPSSFRELEDQTTPRQTIKQRRRRNSDRIRSPSNSSSSSSDDDPLGNLRSIQPRASFERQTSAPPVSKSFPHSLNSAAPIPRPSMPKRPKTLSDPHMDSPLAARMAARNAAGPPSAFGNFGSFARPSPASRRSRRGSSSQYGSDAENHEDGYRPIGRSKSSKSIASKGGSPPWPHGDLQQLVSPTSPDGIDNSPFFHHEKSPESVAGSEHGAVEVAVEDDGSGDGVELTEDEIDETEDTLGDGLLGDAAMNPRLSRLSTGSSLSLRTSHDKLQALQKQNTELARKLKESERQLSLLGADNDRMVVDLERQLEETRHELALKRKEDKDLKNNELTHKIQISGLEADLANVQRLLDQSKDNRASMEKMYDSQCDEAQRLRDMLRDRDAEIRAMEEAAQEHEADEDKYTGEIQSLEAEVKRLESELETARRAECVLETQKQDNLQLKETIDRMRFDLDEARAAAANALKIGGHAKISTGSSGVPTLSTNLGEEINRRLADAAMSAKAAQEDDEGDDSDVIETVVTTRQTKKRGSRAPSGAHGVSGSASVPAIRLEENVVREYADASVGTEPVAEPAQAGPSTVPVEHPPAYTEAEPLNVQDVLDKAHPRSNGTEAPIDEAYDAIAAATGLRCNILEEELKARKAEQAKRGSLFSSWTANGQHRKTIVNHIIYNTRDVMHTPMGMISICAVAAFGIGLVAGTQMVATPAGIHPRDYLLFAQMNDLARSVGAGEGFLPQGAKGVLHAVGNGAGMLAGRVPT